MLKSTVILLLGTLSAKGAPILLGLIVASQLGSVEYGNFVNFLLLSNVVISISVLGGTPQVLALKGTRIELNIHFFKVSSICILIFSLSFLLLKLLSMNGYLTGIAQSSTLGVATYSFGLLLIYLVTSRLNNLYNNIGAAYVWIVYSGLMLLSGTVSYIYYLSLNSLTFLISFSAVFAGIIGFYFAFDYKDIKSFFSVEGYFDYEVIKNSVFFAVFGLLIVGVFFYIQNKLQALGGIDGALFSLFYQLFSLAVFIPAVIGNVLVPKFSRGHQASYKTYVVYLLLAFFLLLPFLFLYEKLFNLYGFDSKIIGFELIFSFYLVCIIASVNSFSTQLLVANQSVKVITSITVVWALIVLTYNFYFEFNLENAVNSLLFGYVVLFFCNFYVVNRKGFIRVNEA